MVGVVLAACDSTESDSVGTIVVDSAGVQITETLSLPEKALGWVISPQPTFTIGAQDGDDSEILYRATGGKVLSEGLIAISNAGSHEVRVYSTTGELVRKFGREGAGPGEFGPFSSMRILYLTEDSLVVSDQGNGRLQVFNHDGTFGRAIYPAVVRGYGRPSVMAALEGSGWLAIMPVGSGVLNGEPGDLIEMSFGFFAYDPSAETGKLLRTVPGRPRMVNSLGGGSKHFPYVPLTPEPVYASFRGTLLVNSSGAPQIMRIRPNGEVDAVIRWGAPRIRVDDIWVRYSEAFLEDVSDRRRPAYARLLSNDRLPVPELVPAVRSIMVDALDHLWVERFRMPWATEREWDILSPDGAWVGVMETPSDVNVYEIGEDYLLGRHRDELGVERVMMFDLAR